MPTKIRLQRHGKKKNSFYHIVIADGRAPRDGKFIEKIGTYNPNTNPATIDLQFDRALNWLQKGAQPTDTTKAILSYEGVLYRNHLAIGVKKGALKEEEAEKKFETWKAEKLSKIQDNTTKIADSIAAERKKRLAAESEVNEKRAKEILAKNSPVVEEAPKAEAAAEEAPKAEAAAEEAPKAEAAAEEAPKAEAAAEEAPKAEAAAEEAPKAEAAAEEAPKAEAAAEEAPKAEAAAEEAPKAEAAAEEAPKAEAAAEEAPKTEAAAEEAPKTEAAAEEAPKAEAAAEEAPKTEAAAEEAPKAEAKEEDSDEKKEA